LITVRHSPRLRSILTSLLLLAGVLVAGCGGSTVVQGSTDADLRSIPEGRATELMTEVAAETGVSVERAWAVDIGAGEPIAVDLRFANTLFGVEWVDAQDRADLGAIFPEPDPDGQLVLMPGAGADVDAQILVLEQRSYRYDPDLSRVQRGAVGVREAEGRLRRDFRDFIEHVRGQGAL
jgi:hypothetical protein